MATAISEDVWTLINKHVLNMIPVQTVGACISKCDLQNLLTQCRATKPFSELFSPQPTYNWECATTIALSCPRSLEANDSELMPFEMQSDKIMSQAYASKRVSPRPSCSAYGRTTKNKLIQALSFHSPIIPPRDCGGMCTQALSTYRQQNALFFFRCSCVLCSLSVYLLIMSSSHSISESFIDDLIARRTGSNGYQLALFVSP